MKSSLITLLLFLNLISFGQNSSKTINFNQFDYDLLYRLVHDRINNVRESLGRQILIKDAILDQAAGLQAKYVRKSGRLSHYHKKKKLRAARNRVAYFKGIHNRIGENLASQRLKLNKSGKSSLTYQELSDELVKRWVNSPGHFKNIKDTQISQSGIGISIDPSKQKVYVAQVFGSPPAFFDGHSSPIDAYDIITERTDKCKACRKGLDTLSIVPIYIGASLREEQLYFHFTDLDAFKRIFNSGSYQFAADVLLRRQFACGRPNALHGSAINEGYLSVPIGRNQLLANNTAAAEGKVNAPMFKLPFKLNEEYEVNLLVLKKRFLSKKKEVCVRYYFSPSYGYNLNIMTSDLKLDTALLPNHTITTKKVIKLEIPFEKNKYEYSQADIQPLYDSLDLNQFNIKQIAITAFASVEGGTENNLKLQTNRAKSIIKALQAYQLDSIPTRIRTFENWRQLKFDIRNTRFAYLGELGMQEVKDELAKDSVSKAIEPILKNHRKAIVMLRVVEKFKIDNYAEEIPGLFLKALNDPKMSMKDKIAIQTKLFKAIEAKELPMNILDSVAVPQKIELIDLLNNELIFNIQNERIVLDLDMLQQLEVLAIKRPDVLFNIYGLMIEWWYKHPNYEMDYPELLNNINRLKGAKGISAGEHYKLLVNYHIVLGTHLKDTKRFRERLASVDFVLRYHTRAKLTEKDALVLANYLVYHHQTAKAASLLRPFTQIEDVNEDVLFYYLSVSIYNDTEVGLREFEINMDEAKQLNKERFCQLYGYPKLTFQLLKNPKLKQLYCENCE